MQKLKQVPSKLYWLASAIIDMFLIFFMSIIKLNKPSDSLSNDDITVMRRGVPPANKNNDYKYKGSRGSTRVYMGG